MNILDFYNHFKNVNSNDDDRDEINYALSDLNLDETFDESLCINVPITIDEIIEAVKCIRNNKSPGINDYLKSSMDTDADPGIFVRGVQSSDKKNCKAKKNRQKREREGISVSILL